MTDENGKPDIFDKIFEIVGGIQITAPTSIIGIVVAYFIYKPTPTRIIFSALSVIIGLGICVVLAILASKSEGTINFMATVSASPELDKKEDEGQKEDEKQPKVH
jgi:hypothetical protein